MTTFGLLRILPPGLYAGRASAMVHRTLVAQRTTWLAVVSGFFEPLFYLLAFQLGFGRLVSAVTGPDGAPLSYAAFVAPGLLAASAMNGAFYESFNIFFKARYAKTYDAVLATPLGPLDVALGEISWSLLRGGLYSVAFVGVMLGMGLVESWWGVLLVPAALLVAFAFSAISMAGITYVRSPQDFDLLLLATIPMFLFSTTFYPASVYPHGLRVVVECFPLYQGVALTRGLATGALSWGMLGHVAYLAVLGLLGVWVSTRRLSRLLLR